MQRRLAVYTLAAFVPVAAAPMPDSKAIFAASAR